ncbi:hypothetical protein [Vibrio fluvialis]|uniref:hypothetical protein n=1 Tax=Vibrio fluvialis TaxID=676 RepID=UPI0012AD92E8|nr:hypothetical protein [Vibrio fluvialis]
MSIDVVSRDYFFRDSKDDLGNFPSPKYTLMSTPNVIKSKNMLGIDSLVESLFESNTKRVGSFCDKKIKIDVDHFHFPSSRGSNIFFWNEHNFDPVLRSRNSSFEYNSGSNTDSSSVDNSKLESSNALFEVNLNKFFSFLISESFEPGEKSAADNFLEKVFEEHGEDLVLKLLNRAALLCFSYYKSQAYLHYLNVLKNVCYYVDYNNIMILAIGAMMHKNVNIQEAAISVLEGIEYKNCNDLNTAIQCLENAVRLNDVSLEIYKEDVINDLNEMLDALKRG